MIEQKLCELMNGLWNMMPYYPAEEDRIQYAIDLILKSIATGTTGTKRDFATLDEIIRYFGG